MVLPVAQLLLLLLRLTRIPRHRAEKWGGALTLAVLLGLLAFGSYQAYSPVVRTYEVRVDKPAGGLEELNVVMAADMHFGLLSGPAHAERLVREIEKLQPDLVLFPGDIIDDDLELYESSGIGEILARIKLRTASMRRSATMTSSTARRSASSSRSKRAACRCCTTRS